MIRSCLACGILAGALVACAAAAANGGTPPALDDSLRTTARDLPKPLWETLLDVPYRVVELPLRGTAAAIAGGVELVDEHTPRWVPAILAPTLGEFKIGYSVSAGGVSGTGIAVSADRRPPRDGSARVRFRLSVSRHGSRRFTAGLLAPAGEDSPRELEFGGGLRSERDARYFGLGPGSSKSRESFYTEEIVWAGLGIRQSLSRGLKAGAELIQSGVRANRPGGDEGLPLSAVFGSELPPGYGRRSTGTTIAVFLEQDSSRETGRPESGGIRKGTFSWFFPADAADASFAAARCELQQFVPLWHSRRALALRAHATRLFPTGGGDIPFQRLLTNDDPDLFRGDRDYRWRDRGLLGLSAEYRWPVWAYSREDGLGLDGYLFADAGQVFHRRTDIAVRRLRTGYGGGLRLVAGGGFFGRVEIARGEDETVRRMRGDQTFQYAKAGLYFGRNPFPIR